MRNTLLVFMFLSTFTIASFPSTSTADNIDQTKSPRFLAHLLDYLAKDYAGAVGANHKILSQTEYNEQVEFVESAVKQNEGLTAGTNASIGQDLKKLEALIKNRESADQVSSLARTLQKNVVEAARLEVSPDRWPSLKQGHSLYVQNCVGCHGDTGHGDGLAGRALEPKPSNFMDSELMNTLSPFNAFNTVRLGVPGTGMPAFQNFSDDETWALSFYIHSLRYAEKEKRPSENLDPLDSATLKKVASLSDEGLAEFLNQTENQKEVLASLRTHSGSEDQNGFLALARTKLHEALDQYRKGEFDTAKALSLQAYLEGIEPVEARIRASDADAVTALESEMAFVRGTIEGRKDVSEVAGAVQAAEEQIDVSAKLIEHNEMSPLVAFFAAFAILLREGFEAVLIILTLLGIIRAAGDKRAALWVHSGWLTALGCGVVAWNLSGWLTQLSGAGREMIEGVTSIFAVLVLLYVGFWLHRQSEIGRWKEFLEVKVRGFLHGKNLFGLALISFVAVFREAFEVVLFLRAIWQDTGVNGQNSMLMGIGSALVLVIGLSWLALILSKRLPLRSLFTLSSALMLGLSTILTGKGLHSIQETGFLPVTSTPLNIHWDLIGLYPTYETLIGQIVVAMVVTAIWLYGRKPGPKKSKETPVVANAGFEAGE